MKVKALLEQAKACKTDEDSATLLRLLERVFGNSRKLAHLGIYNGDAFMEGDEGPFARFELNRVISDEYVTMIRPEIRNRAFVITVRTSKMLDGQGISSQRWEEVDGMDDIIETYPDQTVEYLANLAGNAAIFHHRILIEQIGVPTAIAKKTAKSCW